MYVCMYMLCMCSFWGIQIPIYIVYSCLGHNYIWSKLKHEMCVCVCVCVFTYLCMDVFISDVFPNVSLALYIQILPHTF